MPRWTWLSLGLIATACRRAAAVPDVLPETAPGGWRRATLNHPAASDAPDPVPRSAVDQVQRATYEGPGKLDARVYVLDASAVALDLAQRWRPSADTVFFNLGRFFVVVKWQDADRKALRAFVTDLQMRLGRIK
jgi:hypothetical protein